VKIFNNYKCIVVQLVTKYQMICLVSFDLITLILLHFLFNFNRTIINRKKR